MKRIGFIGAGVMAEAILVGLCRESKDIFPEYILFYDRNHGQNKKLVKTYGVKLAESNASIYRDSDVVFLCVKPQQLDAVIKDLRAAGLQGSKPLVISILAGVPLSKLISSFGHDRVVRVMPNLAAKVSAAMSAIAPSENVSQDDISFVEKVFRLIGETFIVNEKQLDAASAINGCGPAFFFQIIEACSDALVSIGIPRTMSYQISAQTMLGSAKMLLETKEHPAVLKDQVTSPGGTTIEGVITLEKHSVRAAIIEAIRESYKKTLKMS